MTEDPLIAVRDRAVAEFGRNPNVTAVGLGARERNGRHVGELVLKVYVRQKRPPEELTPSEALPPRFEGIGVDVGELDDRLLKRLSVPPAPTPLPPEAPQGSGETNANKTDDTRYRPLIGGARIEADITGQGKGTGGSIWRDKPPDNDPNAAAKRVFLMTNFHAVALPQPDKKNPLPVDKIRPTRPVRVGQPSSLDSRSQATNHPIGTYNGLGDDDALRDAALIELDPGLKYRAEIKCIGVVSKDTFTVTARDVAIDVPYPVRKFGARTRLTGGVVTTVNLTPTTFVGVEHHDLMVITPNPNPEVPPPKRLFFSDEGDSGSAIVNDANQIVGLLFAGLAVGPSAHLTFACPIAGVVSQFQQVDHIDIQPVTATDVGIDQTVPPATPFAPPRFLDGDAEAFARVDADLAASGAGRSLRALWADHQAELLDLMDHRQRVGHAWRNGGGPVMLHRLFHMAADPALTMPATINGVPPMDRLANIHAVLHAHASPELRRALDRALAAVPDPATLTYDQILAAIATR